MTHLSPSASFFHGILCSLSLLVGLVGCADDVAMTTDAPTTSTTTTEATTPTDSIPTDSTPPTTTEATDSTLTGSTPTTTSDGTTEEMVECPDQSPIGDFASCREPLLTVVNFSGHCPASDFPNLHAQFPEQLFATRVYRPDNGAGEWPNSTFPLVVFAHGNGHRYFAYPDFFRTLNRLGFVVAAIDIPTNTEITERGEMALCASRWFASEWPDNDHLTSDLIFMGHSRGGKGVAIAAGLHQTLASPLDVLALRAVLSVAPSKTGPTLSLSNQFPFLFLQGSTDEDATHGAIPLYDSFGIEQFPGPGAAGKWIVWIYDIAHNEFGGHCGDDPGPPNCNGVPPSCLQTSAKGLAALRSYFSLFSLWHVFGRGEFRRFFIGTDQEIPDGQDDPEFDMTDTEFWEEWDGQPQIYRAFVEGAAELSGRRRVLDAFEDGDINMSTASGFVTAAGMVAVAEGEATTLVNTEHRTGALHVSKMAGSTGEVRWQVPPAFRQDLTGFAHFNIRMGNRITVLDEDTCTVVSAPPPEFTLVFEDGGGMEFPVDSATLDQNVPIQDSRIVLTPQQLDLCATTTYMRTLRVPLASLCAQGLVPTDIRAVTLRLPHPEALDVIVDSLEFSRSPFDDPGSCGPPLVCQ